jgi:GNAT superfamily N-acetyltransferase
MHNPFTMHCIAWQFGAPLLQEIRAEACEIGLLIHSEMLPDDIDVQSRHALALGTNGRGIGCARITPEGRIERMAVLPHAHRAQIEAALIEVLNDYAHENKRTRTTAAKTKRTVQSNRQSA